MLSSQYQGTLSPDDGQRDPAMEGSPHHLVRKVHPSVEIQNCTQPMNRRIIWIEDETFTGWCCSHCTWGLTAPRLESTVAALAFNRVAQEGFEKHDCTGSRSQEEARR